MSAAHSRDKRAVFRCDGGAGIGLGHVVRCLALAEALTGDGWSCRFAVSPETARMMLLRHSGFETIELAEPKSAECLAAAINGGTDLLVIDHYGLDADYQRACRGWTSVLLAIEDVPGRAHTADLLLDSGQGREPGDYAGRVPKDCRLLLGPHYALLHRNFAALRRQALARPTPAQAKRVFISFGGVDSKGLCLEALKVLELIDIEMTVDIVIGSASAHIEALKRAGEASRHDVTLHVDCTDVAALLAEADLALGATGGSAWERCVLGVPAITACVADNQKVLYQALIEAGAVVGIGEPRPAISLAIADALRPLLSDMQRRRVLSQKAAALCDGEGADRVAAAIDVFLNQNRAHAEHRPHRSLSS